MKAASRLRIAAWLIAGSVVALALLRWSQVRLSDGEVGPYELFPLFGLSAFSLMWSHYVTDAIRRLIGAKDDALRQFFTITALIVLALILAHPGIFWYQLWSDGFGLPPVSYLSLYTDLASRLALILGSLSLVAFLAFELHRRFKSASWWRYVEYANVAAMFAIFYHALTLGGEVSGWFRLVWFFYGLTLAAAISYNYYHKQGGANHE